MSKGLRVEIGNDAYASCFCHALSTEHEEIMGLLIGTFDVSTVSSNSVVCKIFMSMVLIRSDKRKDRVEIPADAMAGVAAQVEKRGKETGIPDLQVVGWYHSHPHITALPSHVDLGTQMNYQMLDPNFVGLIFSVFNRDAKDFSSSEQVCCFQSVNHQRRLIPFRVVPSVRLFFNNEFASTSGRDDDHAAVMKYACAAVATIFQLYIKEEEEAYKRVDDRTFVDASFPSNHFTRRVSNGAAYAAAITKIVITCHDNQEEAVDAMTKINEVRVEALKKYRDALAMKIERSKAEVKDEI